MKQLITLSVFFLLLTNIILSQEDTTSLKLTEVFIEETPPSFPGGEARMLKFIQLVKSFPDSAKEGKVYIQFVVKKTGELSDINILRSPDSLLSQEAIRILKLMPNWNPGINLNGDSVNVKMLLPITFKKNHEEVYKIVESMPIFPGGKEALFEFLSKSITFNNPLQDVPPSKFYFEFIIEKDGSLSNFKLKKNNPEILMYSALAFTEMPNWDPAKIDDKAIRFKMRIPLIICFK